MRSRSGAVFLWPDFDRAAEETVPGAIPVGPEARVVITEGNYLLLTQPPWSDVRALVDQVWYVDAPVEVLRRRLLERQLTGGRSEQEAIRHVDDSDLGNAELVARTRHLADLIVDGDPTERGVSAADG